ncbi:MAG: SIS domain-containing protein, partial [Candidatus Acidiferrales bacterium]
MTERRSAHPYHMHDAMHAQPECVARAMASQREAVHRAAETVAARKRLWMVGTGSSLHATMVADYFLRHFTRGAGAAVIQSFEFVHYPRELRSDDAVIVISHGGWKSYSAQALAAARAAGALAIAVTGAGGSEHMRGADFVLETCEQEISCAHTKSYTTALALLALLAIRVAANRGYITAEDAQRAEAAVEKAPELQREALKLEAQTIALAPQMAQRLRWRLVGAGP